MMMRGGIVNGDSRRAGQTASLRPAYAVAVGAANPNPPRPPRPAPPARPAGCWPGSVNAAGAPRPPAGATGGIAGGGWSDPLLGWTVVVKTTLPAESRTSIVTGADGWSLNQ